MNSIIWRFIRGAVATVVARWIASVQANPNQVWLAPEILALGKALPCNPPARGIFARCYELHKFRGEIRYGYGKKTYSY